MYSEDFVQPLDLAVHVQELHGQAIFIWDSGKNPVSRRTLMVRMYVLSRVGRGQGEVRSMSPVREPKIAKIVGLTPISCVQAAALQIKP